MNAPLRRLAGVMTLLFAVLFGATTYVQFVAAPSLNAHAGNARTQYKEYGRERGPIVVAGRPIAQSVRSDDIYQYGRQYPGGQMYAPVTGYFSVVYGSGGLEDAESGLLSGTSDQLFYRNLSDLITGRQPQGAAVELTIDPAAQKAAWDALGDQKGAVVAINPRTGAILAMVSKPSYDPNVLASHDTATVRKQWAALNADPDHPLYNRAIGGDLYFPGSTFKIITAATALSSGRFTPDTVVSGPAQLQLPNSPVPLNNDDFRACGQDDRTSLLHALEISCNTAFAQLGMDLGEKAIAEQAAKFGFGQRLQVPMRVTPSVFPTGQDPAFQAYAAIGQKDVRVTPLQAAMVSAAVANGGVLMKPYVVSKVRGADLEPISTAEPTELGRAVSADVAAQLTSMMEAVVTNGTGTRAQIDGIRVAGKTGTAQTLPGKPPTVWFTSFAPVDDPKVAVAVVVEEGGNLGADAFGGTVSAPIARQVIEAVVNR